jgi:LPXTG-motif cell wall-anchored protein
VFVLKNIKKILATVAVVAASLFTVGITSAPAMAAGNYALHFTGGSGPDESKVLVFNGPALTKNFTISADIRWDGTMGYQGIISKATSDSTNAQTGYCLCLADGQPTLAMKDSTLTNRVFMAPTVLSANVWHTIMATYDGEFITVYVDGTLVGTSTSFGANLPVHQSGEPVVFGREFMVATSPDLASRSFHGDLDNARTYDGVYPAALSPVMNYTFSEGTGKRIVDEGPLGSASWLSDNVTPQWVQGSDPVTITYTSPDGQQVAKTARPYDPITLEANTLFNRDGFVLEGWAVDGQSANLNPGETWVVPLVNTQINAVWSPIEVSSSGLAETGSQTALVSTLSGASLLLLGAFMLVAPRKRRTR